MRSVTSIREFASQVVALLKKKISRHYPDMAFDVFARREVEKRDWSEGREKELAVLESFFPGPEYSLLAAALERSAFQTDATLGEAYTAKCNEYCKVLSEKGKDKFVSGECSLLELEWTVCWRWTLFPTTMPAEKTTILSIYVRRVSLALIRRRDRSTTVGETPPWK